MSKIIGKFVDFIYPDVIKTYRVLAGPGRNLHLKINARTQTAVLFGTYERANIDFILTRVCEKTVFWDIGAYIGYFICIISRRATNGYVVAVEPFPENTKLLYENVHLNNLRNVIVIEKALSSFVGLAPFSITQSVSEGRIVNNSEILNDRTIEVPVTTLDILINSGLPAPNIIKIDTEGEEGNILKGATTVLQELRPFWLIEIHNLDTAQHCLDILKAYKYNVLLLKGVSLCSLERVEDISGEHIWAEPIH